jgi:hypothetical protein
MPELLKNAFNEEFLTKLCFAIKKEYEPFDEEKFMSFIKEGDFWDKELKERMRQITHALALTLPDEYERALLIIKKQLLNFQGLQA